MASTLTTTTTTCQFSTGSYLTILSCICLVGITFITQWYHYPSIPPNVRDVHIIPHHNNNNTTINSSRFNHRTGFSAPDDELLYPPPVSLQSSQQSVRLLQLSHARMDEEKVEEGMEVPYHDHHHSKYFNNNNNNKAQPMKYDPYNTAIVSSRDIDISNNNHSATTTSNRITNDQNMNLFCTPVTGMVAAVLSGGNVAGVTTVTSTSSRANDDDDDDDDIVTVEDGDNLHNHDDEEEDDDDDTTTQTGESQSQPEHSTNQSMAPTTTSSSSMLYSTSMMDMDDEEDDPILIYPQSYGTADNKHHLSQNNSNNEHDGSNHHPIHHGRSTNDATVKLSNTTTGSLEHTDNPASLSRVTNALDIPNVSLLDTDTTTIPDETSGSNYDLGSLEPSTINVKDSFLTEEDHEEYDINGDESILDGPEIVPPPPSPVLISPSDTSSRQDQDEIIHGRSELPYANVPFSSNRAIPNTTKDPESVQILDQSQNTKRFAFPKPSQLLNMCRKPLHIPQYHGKHQQRGYQYLEDIEMDALFQPIMMSPPLEILTVRNTDDRRNSIKKIDHIQEQQQHLDDERLTSLAMASLERQEHGLLYKDANILLRRTAQTHADEPEPYLEFSDEELSDDEDDDYDDDAERRIGTEGRIHAIEDPVAEKLDGRASQRSRSGATGTHRRRRRNHSSNRSVGSSKTNLSLLTATIAEETSEDLHNDNDDNDDDGEYGNHVPLLSRGIVPLVRSRSVPNLATYYSTKKRNNEINDDIHMTGIHHYRSAQIFPQSTSSASSPNHRRNLRWNNHYHHHDYRSMENDNDQNNSTSLLSIQRRRQQHQLWYSNQKSNSSLMARSVPDKVVRRNTPLFRTERALMGIHSLKNDEPSTSSSSNNSGDSHVNVNHNDSLLLPSQKARLARFQRLQQQQQKHSLNQPSSSYSSMEEIISNPTTQMEYDVSEENHLNNARQRTEKNILPVQLCGTKDKNETTISTAPDDSIDDENVDEGNMVIHHTKSYSTSSGSSGCVNEIADNNHANALTVDNNPIIQYDHHHRHFSEANPTDLSFDSHSTNSTGGYNHENDSSYMIDLLDVQLAELNRPDGALIGPDEASM